MLQGTRYFFQQLVAAAVVTGKILDPASVKIALLKDFLVDPTNNPDWAMTDGIEADYTGYTASAPSTVSAPVTLSNGMIGLTYDDVKFQPGNATASNLIKGAALLNFTTSAVIQVEKFATPVQLAGTTTILKVILNVALLPTGPTGYFSINA